MLASNVFGVADWQKRRQKQGQPYTLKWIDIVKPDGRYRRRLVVREIKRAKSPEERLEPQDVFSSMPPVESLKMLVSVFMTLKPSQNLEDERIALWDVSRAHFY